MIVGVSVVLIVLAVGLLFFANDLRKLTTMTSPSDSVPVIPVVTKVTNKPVYPSEILDLTNWKITLPIGEEERAREVKQPVFSRFVLNPWFVPVSLADGLGVRFRAPVNGVTTSGSGYPRSELREMTNNGLSKAHWNTFGGRHILVVDQAITAVPKKKKHVVAGQIHDADQDVLVIRLEYPKLFVNVDGENVATLDSEYTLGKRFTVRLEVFGGKTDVFYNNSVSPVYTFISDYSEAYFKVGAYTQSNCTKEEPRFCSDDNYGEVVVYGLNVSHF